MRTSKEITAELDEFKKLPYPEYKTLAYYRHLQKERDLHWERRRAWEREQGIPVVTHSDGSPV